MNYLVNMLISYTIPSFFSALGVTILTLILMYIHYRYRKGYYKKLIPFDKKILDFDKERYDGLNKAFTGLLNAYGVKTYLDFISKKDQKISVQERDIMSNMYKDVSESQDKKFMQEIKTNHLKNYNFKIYLSDFLDRRYPDTYYNETKGRIFL